MPIFHFTLGDGQVYLDPDGEQLRDIDQARVTATRYLSDMLKEKGDEVWIDGSMYVTVTDGLGVEVLKLDVIATDPRLDRSPRWPAHSAPRTPPAS